MTPAAPPSASAHKATPVIAAAMFVGTAAMLVLGLQPVLLGGLTEAGRLTEAQLGQAAMIEIFGLALGSTVGPFAMNTGRMRLAAAGAALLLCLVNLSVFFAGDAKDILIQRAFAGVLEGLLLGATNVVLTHTDRPEKMAGILLGLSTIPQVIAAYALPVLLVPRFGLLVGFVVLAVFALGAAVAAGRLTDRVNVIHERSSTSIHWTPRLVAFLIAAFLQAAGIGAAWNYLERLAHQNHFGPEIVGAALAGSLAFQVGGAFVAAWCSWRIPARPVLVAGGALQAAIVVALVTTTHPATFIAATCVFGLFWLALQPFQVTEVISLDSTRKMAMLMTPLALMGLSAGPFVVSFAMRRGDVSGGYWGAAILLTASALFYGLASIAQRAKSRPNGAAVG